MIALQHLPEIITAVGGLGTAAFGLVDATKVLGGGVNHYGFAGIKDAVTPLMPIGSPPGTSPNALSQVKALATLQANWFNGNDLGSQKAIAKSLIKLNLSPATAPALATATGVDQTELTTIATSMAAGTPLTSSQSDVSARFDFIVTAILDEAYQRADQVYKNWTRAWAMVFAIALAVGGTYTMQPTGSPTRQDIVQAVLMGLLATPLAPIAKDLSTALATAVNTLQLAKK